MLVGVISTRHVLRHPVTIARSYGAAFAVRAVAAALSPHTSTFLALLSKVGAA